MAFLQEDYGLTAEELVIAATGCKVQRNIPSDAWFKYLVHGNLGK